MVEWPGDSNTPKQPEQSNSREAKKESLEGILKILKTEEFQNTVLKKILDTKLSYFLPNYEDIEKLEDSAQEGELTQQQYHMEIIEILTPVILNYIDFSFKYIKKYSEDNKFKTLFNAIHLTPPTSIHLQEKLEVEEDIDLESILEPDFHQRLMLVMKCVIEEAFDRLQKKA